MFPFTVEPAPEVKPAELQTFPVNVTPAITFVISVQLAAAPGFGAGWHTATVANKRTQKIWEIIRESIDKQTDES
jgi:hypothetical protein